MGRSEINKVKAKGILGGDAAAVIGLNRWRSAFEVYMEMTEEATEEKETPEAVYWGKTLKQMVAREFTSKTGKKVRRDSRLMVHKDYPFILGKVDRRVVGENSILLCKTTSVFNAKEWDSDEVPEIEIVKCQHLMAVTGAEKCYIAVLLGGQRFICKEILRDDELINMILDAEKDFWIKHVEKKVPPPVDGSSAAEKYIKARYGNPTTGLSVNLSSDYKDKLSNYLSLKSKIKDMEEEAKTIENNIKNELGQAEKGIVDNFVISWKGVLSSRVDSKALKGKYPEVYKEVCKEVPSRRFEVKEIM